jgi:molybdopterin converting factor small subunit
VAATITVRYWAGAQRAAGIESEALSVSTIAELRETLAARAGFDGQHAGDSERPPEGAVVDVLPPFAGGC